MSIERKIASLLNAMEIGQCDCEAGQREIDRLSIAGALERRQSTTASKVMFSTKKHRAKRKVFKHARRNQRRTK